MTKTAIDYSKACVYRLIYNNITYYVGSTTNMRQRKSAHKHNSINESSDKYNMELYKFIRDNESWEKWDMVLIESYPECKSSEELRKHERTHYDFYKPSLNAIKPYITGDEKNMRIRNYNTTYRQNNTDKIVIDKADYYYRNKDRILEKQNNQYALNSDRHKQYYLDNSVVINSKNKERCMCVCGATYSKRHKIVHQKTQKHIDTMTAINDDL
jgi:hypothetical protein